MNKEWIRRIKTAGVYQKKAIDALFPETIKEHLNRIEKEITMIILETVEEWIKDNKQRDTWKEAKTSEKENHVENYVKKVTIE